MTEYIHDPIHGEIAMSPLAIKIIDHAYFERLQYIQQTGMAYRIFPSSTHTRKSHSIGTYGLTKKLLELLSKSISVDEHTKELISIGALCHDLGHCSGSHLFDKHIIPRLIQNGIIDKNHEWTSHEQRSISIFKRIAHSLNISEDDTKFICKVIDPPRECEDWKFTIVNNKIHGIDTDKLDYISRDNYMLGLKLNIDIDTIISKSTILDNKWSFSHDIQDEIFNIYFVRYRLYRYIYNHPKIVSFDLMFRDIIFDNALFEKLKITFINKDISSLVKWTDSYVLHEGSHMCVERFMKRNSWSFVDFSPQFDDADTEVIPLHIKICNVSKNIKNRIPIHNILMNKISKIDETFFWKMLPTDEHIKYHFKNSNI